MERINRVKLAKIEIYLDAQDIWHESIAVREQPICEILAQYGIVKELTFGEKTYLKSYLHRRAKQAEFAEVVRWVDELDAPLLSLMSYSFPV
jgi:hypothetical protein